MSARSFVMSGWSTYDVASSTTSARRSLIALPLLRHIRLFKILRILVTQLEVDVLHCFLNTLFAAYSNNGANPLLDAPASRNACHTDIVLLSHLLHALNDLLIDFVLALIHERINELVR